MDSQATAAESQHLHHLSSPWIKGSSASSGSRTASVPQTEPTPAHFSPPALELLPFIIPHQSTLFQAQLLQYNQLISPGRGGGSGSQTSPHFTTASIAYTQTGTQAATTRSRSSSKVSNKDNQHPRPGAQNCHGNKTAKRPSDTADRVLITLAEKETPNSKMAGKKQADKSPKALHSRPPTGSRSTPPAASGEPAAQSSSVPSTPHQRPRKYSFDGSREPSPGATQNHSPRSAYSETNITGPSLRPLPPRLPGCRFETAFAHSRRRMNYNIGTDKLEKVDADKIKSKLSEDDERKLTTDMRELYDRLIPTQEREKNRHKLVQKLEKVFNAEWPGHNIRVHLFGSSGNLLCSDDSDVDICITTEWKELEGVCIIAELLHRHGMENVVCVSTAKVPIVKIWDPELKLACDMNVNNTLALENTRMVRTYVQIDERVRPLAMIIKHWTRRRIVNDAAFGGTLSSYTWICMIIAFLQLRKPPVLPALHQRPERLTDKDGKKSDFADDVEKLRDFGKNNKESLGALLFQFFKFYAHDFDYDKYALSVRLGKLVLKTDKKWHVALNNCLCVEEPWNTIRNLGNTADDTAFRGLHLELRRAFDLISDGKLDECCEQYIFPKEEEKIWHKPAPAPRPALLRSSSQQHSNNRGGRGGWRGNGGGRQYRNGGGNSSRRASSVVAYETNAPFPVLPSGIPTPQMTSQEAQYLWYQAQQGLHPDLYGAALTSLQAQEHSLRFQLLTQQQLSYNQQAQQAIHASQQRMRDAINAANSAANGGTTQATDRSRTNSFDNPPLTAPIRTDVPWIYSYAAQPNYYSHAYTTYPSSPSATNSGTAQDFRRSLHRSTVTSDSGVSTGSGSLRSQSQPASRPSVPNGAPQAVGVPGYAPVTQPSTSVPTFSARQMNGMTISHLMLGQAAEQEFDDAPTRPMSETPPDDDGARYVGYYVHGASSPVRRAMNPIRITNGIPAIPPYGGSNQERRRPSAEQTPQSILDRRMKRTSRSPSPAGHARAFSVGTSSAPLASAPFPQTGSSLGPTRGPLIVNGTAAPPVVTSTSVTSRQPSVQETVVSEDTSYNNPLHINQQPMTMPWLEIPSAQPHSHEPSPVQKDRPVIVNGSTPATAQSPAAPQPLLDSPSFKQRVAMSTLNINATPYHGSSNGAVLNGYQVVPPTNRVRAISRQQQNGIEPLDLATNEVQAPQEVAHLSPVYEHQTPSPSFARKFDSHRTESGKIPPGPWRQPANKESRVDRSPPSTKPSSHHKSPASSGPSAKESSPRTNGAPRENGHGHTRGQKSDSDHSGGWQKQKSKKKAGVADLKNAAVEQMPKNDADRKGG